MTLEGFLEHLRKLNVEICAEGDRLHCRAPRGVLSSTLRAELVVRKSEILTRLTTAPPAAALPAMGDGLRCAGGDPPEPFVPYKPVRPGSVAGLSPQQQEHLKALGERYTRRTGGSKRWAARYRAVFAENRATAGFRLLTKEMLYPIVAERSQGSRFWDIDGNEYIDLTMGFGALLFGHSPRFVVAALERQFVRGLQIGPQSELAGAVATETSGLTGMERTAFCNSGTEAIMLALRLARTATGRSKVAVFAGSFHGSYDVTLSSARTVKGERRTFAMAPGITQGVVDDVLVLDYGSPDALVAVEAQADELAAVLVEPVQSRRPDLQPGRFLQELRRVTERAGIALVFDEIVTGFRVHPGGAQALFGVRADMATYGKVLGGGMPIGIVSGSARYLNGVDGGPWSYGDLSYPRAETTFTAGTFSKHPLAMAAALAVLGELKREGPGLQERLNERTQWLADTLNRHFKRERVPIRVVHFGSLFRFLISGDPDLLFYHLAERGIYVWEGRNCFLSTAHTNEDLERVVGAVQESVEELRDAGFLKPAHNEPPAAGSRPRN